MKPVRCPWCRVRIDGRHVWAHRSCAACGARLGIRRRYVLTTYLLALVVSACLAYAVGNRGSSFLSLASLLALPTFWGMLWLNAHLFPLDVKVLVPGWTPGDPADAEIAALFESVRESDLVISLAEPDIPAELPSASTDAAPGWQSLSTPKDPPVTFEGILIAIGFSALIAYHVYSAIAPHIESLW